MTIKWPHLGFLRLLEQRVPATLIIHHLTLLDAGEYSSDEVTCRLPEDTFLDSGEYSWDEVICTDCPRVHSLIQGEYTWDEVTCADCPRTSLATSSVLLCPFACQNWALVLKSGGQWENMCRFLSLILLSWRIFNTTSSLSSYLINCSVRPEFHSVSA